MAKKETQKRQLLFSLIAVVILFIPIYLIGSNFGVGGTRYQHDLADNPTGYTFTNESLTYAGSPLNNGTYIEGITSGGFSNEFIIDTIYTEKIVKDISIYINVEEETQFTLKLSSPDKTIDAMYQTISAKENTFINYTFSSKEQIHLYNSNNSQIRFYFRLDGWDLDANDYIQIDSIINYTIETNKDKVLIAGLMGTGFLYIMTGLFMTDIIDMRKIKKGRL